MCGIAGFTQFHRQEGDEGTLQNMGEAIAHRGPDASGTFLDSAVGLVHRRLSILDLSAAGNQPMYSEDGNVVIVFNGEIFNFQTLRNTLEQEGVTFKSATDTEVIIALYQRDGLECVKKLNGMFAFAIWDKKAESLFLARDRLGKKPLYYYSENNRFAFASEIKAILELEDIPRKINTEAVFDFFAYQYIPDPKSIFNNIHKLPPAHIMTVTRQGIHIEQYWDLSFKNTTPDGERLCKQKMHEKLEEATKNRMVSDVPLGAFLSGGVDSSGVVALMANASETPIKTCTIGFDDPKFNEAEFAREIANQYGTEHHEFTVHQNVAERLAEITRYFDEPFADPSLVPTFFVSELARQEVTVAISGDGGDEMFAGYEKYHIDNIENQLRNKFPLPLRQHVFPLLAKCVGLIPGTVGKKGKSLLLSLSQDPAMGFYITNSMMTDEAWQTLAKPAIKSELGNYHPSQLTLDFYNNADGPDHLSKILYTDIKTYMTGGILVKVDRMSMANSLEVRAPILDYEVAELAATLPSTMKYKNGEKKYLLKEIFKPYIPNSLLYRKKMGFSVPLDEWFRNELKELTEITIFKSDKGLFDYFEKQEVHKLWHQHQKGSHHHGIILWSMLMFQLWYERYIKNH